MLTEAAKFDEFTIKDLETAAVNGGLTIKRGALYAMAFRWRRLDGLTRQTRHRAPYVWAWVE